MTYKINRDGQTIELNDMECWQIYCAHLENLRRQDLEQLIDWYEEDETYSPEVIAYMRENIKDALDRYTNSMENGEEWADIGRAALERLAEDYESETV